MVRLTANGRPSQPVNDLTGTASRGLAVTTLSAPTVLCAPWLSPHSGASPRTVPLKNHAEPL